MIDAFCVRWSTRVWMDFVAIWWLGWVSVCLGRCRWSRLDLWQFELICIDVVGFDILFWSGHILHDCKNGRLGWVRIVLGIFGELGLVNLIGLFDFNGFELFGWIWVDFNRFAWICADLGWLERIAVDLEDRYKFIFAGFGIIRWIRLDMATYLDGSGKIWMALSGFDWIWGDLVGFGWIWVQIRVDF